MNVAAVVFTHLFPFTNLMKKYTYLYLMFLLLPLADGSAQELSMTFDGETLSDVLRRMDQAQNDRSILFLFDDLEMFTVTADIAHLSVAEAVRRVCSPYPISVTEFGDNIFVEYVPKNVHLDPIVVNGRRIPLPSQLFAAATSPAMATLQEYARHIVYFNSLCPQEKVYLHFDNTAYFQGETIWFAATVVGASDRGEAASKVLYVELLSPTGEVLQTQKLKVVDGRCHGSFPLIDASVKKAVERRGAVNLPSGYYEVRAYTRSMLNFDAAGIFSRVIPVYTSPKDGAYETASVTAYPYLEEGRPDAKSLSTFNITFYPEGGHLLQGVESRIAFKATDQHGIGIPVDAIIDSQLRPLTLSSQHDGMGSFRYTGTKGKEKVDVVVQGQHHTVTLPVAEAAGCALTLDGAAADTITADIRCVGIADSLLAYTVVCGGNVLAADTLQPSREGTVVKIGRRVFPMGVCQFTVYGQDGAIYAQRMFFSDGVMERLPLAISFSQEEYRPFHPVDMKVQTASGEPACFSLSVRDAADYGTSYSDDIRSYMLLSSELKGLIEHPGWYFEESISKTERTEALDLLMMVQGWTRYDWQQMAGVKPIKVTNFTEEQLVLDGWAFSRILEKPLADTKVDIALYSPDRKYKQKTTVVTDSLGYWSVGLDDFVGDWDLSYTTHQSGQHKAKATTRIRLSRADKPRVSSYHPVDTFLPDHKETNRMLSVWTDDDRAFEMPQDAIVLEDVEVQAERLYVDYGTFHAYDTQAECARIYDEGNYTPDYDEYLRTKGIYRTPDGDLWMPNYNVLVCPMDSVGRSIFRHANCNLQNERGLEYIQSIMVYDPMSDPGRLPCVQEHCSARGVNWHAGTIAELTRPHGIGSEKFIPHYKTVVVEVIYAPFGTEKLRKKNSRETTFAGYSKPVEFYSPTYPNGPVAGDEDYRRTLYWNPEVRTDSTGSASFSFYNNGYSRSFTVSAEGLTKDGRAIIGE